MENTDKSITKPQVHPQIPEGPSRQIYQSAPNLMSQNGFVKEGQIQNGHEVPKETVLPQIPQGFIPDPLFSGQRPQGFQGQEYLML